MQAHQDAEIRRCLARLPALFEHYAKLSETVKWLATEGRSQAYEQSQRARMRRPSLLDR